MSEPPPLSRARPLRGRDVRHAALALLDRCGALSISELLEALAADGFAIAGEGANKTLSDALRHETNLGRARRVGWGRYAIAEVARTTLWRIRSRWRNATDIPAVRRRPWEHPPTPRVTVDFGRLMPSDGNLDAIVSALMAELLAEPLLPAPP